MGLIRPDLPDFDVDQWSTRPEGERVRMMCESWALQGFGAPLGAYLFYLVKIALYIGLWLLFATRTSAFGGVSNISAWWSQPIAFQKAIVWTMLFEVLGLGCGSGPLTGRYLPPVVAFTHFLRPGTIRLPPFPNRVPLTAGHRRTVVDALLYAALIALSLRALLWSGRLLGAALLWPIVVAVPLIGLRDKTVFLAARAEHYWTTLLVFLIAGSDVKVMFAGAMVVQLAIWWGAAASKLNRHFPNVITIMVSNSPIIGSRALKRLMYVDHPSDLRPSRVARALAHGGTAIEFTFPLVLAISRGGLPTDVALGVMVAFHLFITSCFPMGVPIEWNVLFVYSMFVLFGAHSAVSPLEVTHRPLLVVLLVTGLISGPVYGAFRPDRVSFLPGLRFYAGNWAASLWLFRKGQEARLDECVTKTAPTIPRQLSRLYDDQVVQSVGGKLRAFRSMHVHGRALNALLARAVDDLADYDVTEGEGVAGVVLGWNFGDGHLHQEQLLSAVQHECGFASGDLRCVFLESQPINKPWMQWRIVDAADGRIAEGRILVADLLTHQPWPEDEAIQTEVAQ